MGGIGKTVAARLLADDLAIRRRYHDSIFWCTAGESLKAQEIENKQRGLLETLRDNAYNESLSQRWLSIDELRDAIARELDGRSVLIVVDDVWTSRDVRAFNIRSKGCAVLFIGRKNSGFEHNDVPVKNVELLGNEEAEELFRAYAKIDDSVPLDDIQQKILGHANCHVLGVVVAGSMVGQYPTRTALILDLFDKADVSRISAVVPDFRRSDVYPDQETNIFRIPQISFELLGDREKGFLSYLAIFPEDMPIPMEAIELFGPVAKLDELDVESCVKNLDDAALLTFHGMTEAYSPIVREEPLLSETYEQKPSSYVTFHDLR